MDNRSGTSDKWKSKQHIILGDIINWRLITDTEYRLINDAFENMNDTSIQSEPILQNPIQGGRRKSRRSRRKSRRKSRRSRR